MNTRKGFSIYWCIQKIGLNLVPGFKIMQSKEQMYDFYVQFQISSFPNEESWYVFPRLEFCF